jgi:hypothetical protein
VELAKKVTSPAASGAYPAAVNTPGKRALYDNLERDEELALAVDAAVRASRQDDWRGNVFKIRRVRNAIRDGLAGTGADAGGGGHTTKTGVTGETLKGYVTRPSESLDERVERILALVKNQDEY